MADLNLSAHLGELAQGLDQHSVESEFRSGNDASPGPTAGIGHLFHSDNLSLGTNRNWWAIEKLKNLKPGL